jgi:transposase-like protein
MARPRKYPDELVQRAVRLALEGDRPIAHIAHDLGMHPERLRKKVRQHEADSGTRPDLPTSQEREEIRRLRQENYELRRANEILKSASVFRQGARPRPSEVTAFVDEHRGRFGVEPICRTLDVSASAYYQRRTGQRSARSLEDERLLAQIRELHEANCYAYGSRRMWIALRRAGQPVARCTVERLMRTNGLQGAKRRGKPWRTTSPDPVARRRPDLVDRDFTAAEPTSLGTARNGLRPSPQSLSAARQKTSSRSHPEIHDAPWLPDGRGVALRLSRRACALPGMSRWRAST